MKKLISDRRSNAFSGRLNQMSESAVQTTSTGSEQTTVVTELSITVDRGSALPLSEQVRGGLRRLIEDGSLAEGSPLPSTRQLAADLEVSRSVVVEAYEQLVAEGYLATRRGAGTRVANGIGTAAGTDSALTRTLPERTESAWDLRTGTSDLDAFPRREWVRAVTAALTEAGRAELGYTPLSGAPHLRHVLAGYLGRTRGVRISPQNLMITAGFAQGLALLCAMLREQGHEELGVEDPSHPGEREFVASAGLRPVGVPVDAEGLRVDLLERSGVRAVLTTPAPAAGRRACAAARGPRPLHPGARRRLLRPRRPRPAPGAGARLRDDRRQGAADGVDGPGRALPGESGFLIRAVMYCSTVRHASRSCHLGTGCRTSGCPIVP